MQKAVIGVNEAGQRLDKFLHKFLPEASTSFLYKMLRKKNIELNGKKAEGKEMLQQGDEIRFFFSEETFAKFTGKSALAEDSGTEYGKAYGSLKGIVVLYEDEDMLILNKPAGILTQKAEKNDLSLNEWMIGYLIAGQEITAESLHTFRPSVCNRLDRNTSGIVLCGKSLKGSQELSRMIKERAIRKFYRTIVWGNLTTGERIQGCLKKDSQSNKVTVTKEGSFIETVYAPLKQLTEMTYLEVELITGKTHQIRAHMASIGHPLLGDYKYAPQKLHSAFRERYGLSHQLLHAYRVEFPDGKTVTAPLPKAFHKLLEERD